MHILDGNFNEISERSLPIVTATEIICGDCAGDDLSPKTTELTNVGRCAGCGGRNYILASKIHASSAQVLGNTKEFTNYGTQN